MDSTQPLIDLYVRDLNRLANELDALSAEQLWTAAPGVINSCGVLIQHVIGNLHYYIGVVLGNTGYIRNREREFTNTGASKETLLRQIKQLQDTITEVLSTLKKDGLSAAYPNRFPFEADTEEGLVHLYGHLNYHLGQVNYLRRIIEEKG